MKKLLGLGLYGLVLFGVSAGVGITLHSKTASHEDATAEALHGKRPASSGASAKASGHVTGSKTGHLTGNHAPDPHQIGTAATALDRQQMPTDRPLPVAVRPTPMTVEEIVRYGLGLKAKDEAIRRREDSLARLETQQQIAMSDIESEKTEIVSLFAKASGQREATETLLQTVTATQQSVTAEKTAMDAERELWRKEKSELEAERQKLVAEKATLETERDKWNAEKRTFDIERQKWEAEMKRLQNGLDPNNAAPSSNPGTDPNTTQAGIKILGPLIEGMTPGSAAEMMQELANDGKLDMVVEIIVSIEQRKAGPILDAVKEMDKKLLADLLQKIAQRTAAQKATIQR